MACVHMCLPQWHSLKISLIKLYTYAQIPQVCIANRRRHQGLNRCFLTIRTRPKWRRTIKVSTIFQPRKFEIDWSLESLVYFFPSTLNLWHEIYVFVNLSSMQVDFQLVTNEASFIHAANWWAVAQSSYVENSDMLAQKRKRKLNVREGNNLGTSNPSLDYQPRENRNFFLCRLNWYCVYSVLRTAG